MENTREQADYQLINRNFNSDAIDADEASRDLLFTDHKYADVGRAD